MHSVQVYGLAMQTRDHETATLAPDVIPSAQMTTFLRLAKRRGWGADRNAFTEDQVKNELDTQSSTSYSFFSISGALYNHLANDTISKAMFDHS